MRDRRGERRLLGEDRERLVEHRVVVRRRVRPEVGRLHGPGSAPGGHREPVARELPPEPRGPRVFVRAPGHRVPAHDAHHPLPVQEFVEGVGEGVVVHGAQHRGEDVPVGLGPLEPGVRAGVRRRLVPPVGEPREQLVRCVQEPSVGVEGQSGGGREDQCPRGPDARGGVLLHGAAEEDGTRGVRGEQRGRTARQVDGLDAVSGERTARRDDLVELGECLDLTVAGVRGGCFGGQHPPMLSTPGRRLRVSPRPASGPST